MKKTKNIKPYNYQDDTMPCCVNDSGIDGEISEEFKELIDERLAKIENGTTTFFSNEDVERECQLRLQTHRQEQHKYV